MSIIDWLKFGILLLFIAYVVHPLVYHFKKRVESWCKPIMFPYQHVLITGCGTGLGRSLVHGIFTRGAIITMIGKDE